MRKSIIEVWLTFIIKNWHAKGQTLRILPHSRKKCCLLGLIAVEKLYFDKAFCLENIIFRHIYDHHLVIVNVVNYISSRSKFTQIVSKLFTVSMYPPDIIGFCRIILKNGVLLLEPTLCQASINCNQFVHFFIDWWVEKTAWKRIKYIVEIFSHNTEYHKLLPTAWSRFLPIILQRKLLLAGWLVGNCLFIHSRFTDDYSKLA